MLNDISQAIPEGQVNPQGTEVPGQTAEQVSAQEEPQKEQALTVESVRALIRDEATRIAQSQVAKGENRINARIQEQFKALDMNRQVLGLSDDQVTQARQKIVTDAYVDQNDGEAQTGAYPQAMPDGELVVQMTRALTNGVQSVFQRVGVKPSPQALAELKPVMDAAMVDDDGYSKVILAATQLAMKEAEKHADLQDKATARVIGGGGRHSNPNDISGITDSKELYRLGEKRFEEKK